MLKNLNSRAVTFDTSSFRFSKADRLTQRAEFLTLTRVGKKIQNSCFIAYVAESKTERLRLGITVTKKIGHAVARNRFKRLIREYVRQNRQGAAGCWDINVIVKKQATNMDNEGIFIAMENLFERINSVYCR